MCLLKVKEEPYYSEPVRVKQVRRVRRSYSPEPSRTARYSNTRIIKERRPSSCKSLEPEPAPLPPPPPSFSAGPPPGPPTLPPASVHNSFTKIETRHTSRAPSVHQSPTTAEPEPAPAPSRRTSRAPSVRSPTQASYVEVSHEPESPGSSSSSSKADVRSQSTRHTSNTHKSATARKSSVSVSKSPAPISEYSEHEKEFRRERAWSGGQRQPEYETYQYVNAPPNYGRKSDYDDRRASRGSVGHRSERELHVRHRDYWR